MKTDPYAKQSNPLPVHLNMKSNICSLAVFTLAEKLNMNESSSRSCLIRKLEIVKRFKLNPEL